MKHYLSLIKFSHTIFALPFAFLGYFLAVNLEAYSFSFEILGLVVLCMVFARSAAMAFNRYLDRNIDKENPRTAVREIPSGVISPGAAFLFVVLNAALFVLTTWFINPICFYLSPLALLVVLGYSYTKRFTWLCHFVLGLGLSLAPIGAYLAVTATFDILPVLYAAAVLFWVSGFDIIYSLQDEDFDKSMALYSVPTFLGKSRALKFSELIHFFAAVFILFAAYRQGIVYPELQYLHWAGVIIFLLLLIYQHRLIRPDDLSRVNLAFFTTNGIASLVLSLMVILDFYI